MNTRAESLSHHQMESGSYTIEVIETGDDLNRCREEWLNLLDKVPTHEFHQNPDNIQMQLAHTCGGTRLRIFLIRKGGTLCCIAPFALVKGQFRLSLGIIPLWRFSLHQYRLYGTNLILAKQADPQGCLYALAEALRKRQNEYRLIYIESLPYSSPLYRANNPLPGFRIYPAGAKRNIVWGLRTSNSFAEYLSTFRKKRRYNLNRSVRLLGEAFQGDYSIEKVTRPEQVEEFLVAVDAIYENCWQKNTYGAFRHSTPGNIAYHRSLARSGWLRSYLLRGGGTPVAYIIGYQYRSRYYYEYIGYDQKWGKLSPGTVLTYRMIEDLHTHDRPEILDFGYGDSSYKRLFGNFSHEANYTHIVPGSSPMRMVLLVQLGLSRLYDTISRILIRTGLDKKARKVLKRQ